MESLQEISLKFEDIIIDDDSNDNYCTLLSMFPNIRSQYIREICDNPPFNVPEGQSLLVMLINYLLGYEEENSKTVFESKEISVLESSDYELAKYIEEEQKEVIETTKSDQTLSEILQTSEMQDLEQEERDNEQLFAEFLKQDTEEIENKMKILVNILPDANPCFLKKHLEENHGNVNSLQELVESFLLNKNYEKRDKYVVEKNSKAKIEKYISAFKVEKFIQEFPEPFEHFENPERIAAFQEKALIFLKNRYSSYSVQSIENVYKANKYNLSISDNKLQELDMKPSLQMNIPVDDVPLLQEIAFIQNKETIQNYLGEIEKKEEKELKLLKAQKLLLECQCCFDDLKPQDCIECENNHIFCKRCVIKGTNLAVSNGEATVHCFVECDKEISLNVLRRVLPEPNFDALLKKRQEFEIKLANLNNLVNCPFCTYSEELDPEIKIFTCKNSECMKISCRLCQKLNHLPIKCENVIDEDKGRLYIEEEMSKALIRVCYNCNKPFVKDYGCNKMQCSCGAMMCYLCKQPITGYNHFEGSNKCGTHQDSIIFDKEQVEISRVQATSKLKKEFPDLNLPDIV